MILILVQIILFSIVTILLFTNTVRNTLNHIQQIITLCVKNTS